MTHACTCRRYLSQVESNLGITGVFECRRIGLGILGKTTGSPKRGRGRERDVILHNMVRRHAI
jgi:hypothetical protein